MARSIPYKEFLSDYLQDTEIAFGYLNEVLADYKTSDELSQKRFLLCLRNIAQALGKKNIFSETTLETENPRLRTLIQIVEGLFDCEIVIQLIRKPKSPPKT